MVDPGNLGKPPNLVTDPPLKSPVLLNDGRFTRPWAVWFQQLFIRTSFKGGNAIDNSIVSLEETIAQVNQNETDIGTNTTDIAANTANIATNTDDIADLDVQVTANTGDIATNTSDIVSSRKRAFGANEPAVYDETSTSYTRGDYVTRDAIGGANNFYYRARQAISAPAGPFNASLWDKIGLDSVYLLAEYQAFSTVKAIVVQFQGTASVGAVTPAFSYNVDTFERTATGIYEGSVSQTTFYGQSIFTKAVPVLSHKIDASANTDFFEIEFTDLGSGDFRLEVFEVTKGAGNDLVRTLYDPTTAGDEVSLTLLADLNSLGDLPPP